MEATHYQLHGANQTYRMQQPLQVYIAQGQDLDLAHIRQSCIIHIHADVGLYASLILSKLGMCPWITELTALAQSAHHISCAVEVWVTKFHAKRCSKLGSLSQIVVDVVL